MIDTTDIVPFGYGCCIFINKEDYIEIYEDYKIFYGDTILIVSIVDMKRKRMYYIDNLITVGRISVSSNAYPESMDTDRIAFNRQYRILEKWYA